MGMKRHLSTVVRPPGGGGVDVDRAQMGETSTDAGRRPPVERGLVGDLLKAVGAVAVVAALIGGPVTALARVTGYAVDPGSSSSSTPSPQPWPWRAP